MKLLSLDTGLFVAVASAMTIAGVIFWSKIRSLKNDHATEDKRKENQLLDLEKKAVSLQDELAKTAKEFMEAQQALARAQSEIGDLKGIETKANSELNRLQQFIDYNNKERARIDKENTANKEIIARQQQELERANIRSLEAQSALIKNEQRMQELASPSHGGGIKTKELETGIAQLKLLKEANEKTIAALQQKLNQATAQRLELQNCLKELQDADKNKAFKIQELESRGAGFKETNDSKDAVILGQREELDRALSHYTELQNTLQEKVQRMQELEATSQSMASRIKALELNITALEQQKDSNEKTGIRQQQELKQAAARSSKFRDLIREKEAQIKQLEEVKQSMDVKLQKTQSRIKELEKEAQTRRAIIARSPNEGASGAIKKVDNEAPAEEDVISLTDRKNKEAELKNLLLNSSLITEANLEKALELQENYGGSLLRSLFVNRDIDEKRLAESLSAEFDFPYLPMGNYEIPDEIVGLLPSDIVEKYWVLPVDKVGNNLMVVMVDPFDSVALKDIAKASGCRVKAYLGLFSEIAEKIKLLYKLNIQGVDAQGNVASPIFINAGEYNGRERRKAVRFKARLPLRIADDDRVAATTTEDISWGGLSFKLDRELPIDSTLALQLGMPESRDDKMQRLPIPAVAQVRRSTPLADNSFMIGVKLLKIPREDIHIIIQHVSNVP